MVTVGTWRLNSHDMYTRIGKDQNEASKQSNNIAIIQVALGVKKEIEIQNICVAKLPDFGCCLNAKLTLNQNNCNPTTPRVDQTPKFSFDVNAQLFSGAVQCTVIYISIGQSCK